MAKRDHLASLRDDTAGYHSRVSVEHKYLAMAVPKVGCSTIKRTLHAFEGFAPAERLALEHTAAPDHRLTSLSPKQLANAIESPDWLRFTFVRNPYARLLSAWKSKILAPDDTQYAPLRAEIRAAFNYPTADEDSPVVAFGDFVRFITTPGTRMAQDGHFERQFHVGGHNVIRYDVVGRFENFAEDFATVLTRLGAGDDVLALAHEVTNPTSALPASAAYDSELAAIAFAHYRVDFVAFGYDRDSWHTPKLTPG